MNRMEKIKACQTLKDLVPHVRQAHVVRIVLLAPVMTDLVVDQTFKMIWQTVSIF